MLVFTLSGFVFYPVTFIPYLSTLPFFNLLFLLQPESTVVLGTLKTVSMNFTYTTS